MRPWIDSLFATTVGEGPARLRLVDGGELAVDVNRWHQAPTPEDHDALSRTVGPVLDIGCGPGRHVVALLDRRHEALGIDISPAAVRAARRRGARAVRTSVWGAVPRVGHWQTALLLDGNIGIGGDPVALLQRTAELLGGARRIVVELAANHTAGSHVVRVEHGGSAGPWFTWALVTPASIGEAAASSDLAVDDVWESSGRWFAVLSGRSTEWAEWAEAEAPLVAGPAA